MKQIVKLPENAKDITLYQYQKLVELLAREDLDKHNLDNRKLHLFTGLKITDIDLLTQKDREEMLNQIDIALNEPYQFEQTFYIDNIEFGFIPNLDKITGAEYFDLSKYGQDNETLHNLMAILFRPIINKDSFGNYSIAEYKGTEEMAEAMRLTPMNVVNGALFFFANLRNELLNCILKYTEQEQVKVKQQVIISRSGDGMQPSMS